MGSKIWFTQNICYQINFLDFKHCHCLLLCFPPQILWNLRSKLWLIFYHGILAGGTANAFRRSKLVGCKPDPRALTSPYLAISKESPRKSEERICSSPIRIPSRAGFRTEKFPLLEPELDLSSKYLELEGGFLSSAGLKFDQCSYPGDFFPSIKSKEINNTEI